MFILGFGVPGGTELMVVLFVILLLFGAKKLPELSRSLGKSLGEFRKGQAEGALPDSLEEQAEKKKIAADSSDEENKNA